MLKAIFNWFSHKNPAPESQAPTVKPEAAPYKVEAPAVTKPVSKAAPVATAIKKPAVIKAAPKKAVPAKKPAAKKAPAKKATPKKSS
jgi:trigger factor